MKEEVASVFGVIRGLTALFAVLVAGLAISACGGEDTPDTDGGLGAAELAAMLPDGGTPQAIAVDVDAAREAAGLAEGTDPTEISTSREELRFGLSTFSALLSLAALTDNPVRAAIDHSKLSAYAAHPYISERAVNTGPLLIGGLYLVVLGAVTIVWTYHIAVLSGDMEYYMILFGGSLMTQGTASLVGFGLDSRSMTIS
jgi:hypothetical protein